MRASTVDLSFVKDILNQQLADIPNLEGCKFLKFTVNNILYISYIRYQDGFQPQGRLVMENIGGKWNILPSIMDILTEVPTHQIASDEIITEITFGKPIPMDLTKGNYMILDKNNNKIALGKISNGYFIPVCDLGYYLRAE